MSLNGHCLFSCQLRIQNKTIHKKKYLSGQKKKNTIALNSSDFKVFNNHKRQKIKFKNSFISLQYTFTDNKLYCKNKKLL